MQPYDNLTYKIISLAGFPIPPPALQMIELPVPVARASIPRSNRKFRRFTLCLKIQVFTCTGKDRDLWSVSWSQRDASDLVAGRYGERVR